MRLPGNGTLCSYFENTLAVLGLQLHQSREIGTVKDATPGKKPVLYNHRATAAQATAHLHPMS